MKPNRRDSCRGSVLLSAAVSASVLAILIAGVLAYLSNEYNLNNRAHSWNQAFHLAESAAEVGIAEYNYQYSLGGSGVGFQSANGWSSSGSTYTKTVSNLTDTSGKVVGTVKVTATGIGTSNPQFQGEGTVTSSNYGGQSLSRAVLVTLAGTSSLFKFGLLSKSALSWGGGVFIDSYDSSDAAKSTNGQYDANKKQANGNIATLSTSANAGTLSAVRLGNSADVYGTITTGPGGTVSFSGAPRMGPVFSGQATTVAQGVNNGWITSALTSPPPDVTVPSALAAASNIGTISLQNSGTMTINSGDFQVNALSVIGNSSLKINGTVRLYVLGNVTTANSGTINIMSGSSLTVYVAGPTINISGAGIVNGGLRSQNNQWFGLPTMNTGTIANSGVFNGTLYAPSAMVTISGAGSLTGALVASNMVLSGSGAIHFDESLKNGAGGGAGGSYQAVSWQELRYVNGSWVP